MKSAALEHLVCLNCLSDLQLDSQQTFDDDHPNEIYEGILRCTSCSREYKIVRGVPRFVDENESSPTDIRTGASFAEAWKRFPMMDERYRKQFFDWVFPVDADFLKGKVVLECGCGKGRHAKLLQEAGVKAIYAVDIGEAIDIAYQNVGFQPGVHLVQADIERLPFRRDFDFAFSVGVLHHMESPLSGFQSMSSKVKPTGSIVAWVYGRENNWWLIAIVNPIRELITSKMPSSLLLSLSAAIALPLVLYCKLVARPWMNLKKRHNWVPPLYYGEYLSYIAQFGFTELHHIVFDHLIAPVAYYVPRAYFASWFKEAGWTDSVIRWHNRNSWSGFSSADLQELEFMRKRVKEAADSSLGAVTARSEDRSGLEQEP